MKLVLDNQQEQLFIWTKVWHRAQQRKYTGAPYWTHLFAVARNVHSLVRPCGWIYDYSIEVALLHDLFEDTSCTSQDLLTALNSFGYSKPESFLINDAVLELTDMFTKEKYPDWNRYTRKTYESTRLGHISILAQTVKLADLIDNTKSIIKYDEKFARIYLVEKRNILDKMRKGDIDLYIKACAILDKGFRKLGI